MSPREEAGEVCIYQEPNLPFRAMGVAWPHSAEHWRPRHCHRELELNLVTRGRARFALDSDVYELGPGELLWFLPHTGHELSWASPDFDMWIVAFRPELVERVAATSGGLERALSSHRAPRARLDASSLNWSEGALRSSFQRLCAGRAPEPALVAQVLSRLWHETAVGQPADEPLHSAVRRARTLVASNPRLARAELADTLSVSESTLAHAFQRDVGVSFSEYRNRVRVGRLLELLEDPPPSLLRAGLAAGFGSAAQYHRCVRALAGCRPAELANPEIRRALAERVRGASSRSAR
jgi:AraC-like DNA-binding protein/quercetin dioxygenase-like cupin family protein